MKPIKQPIKVLKSRRPLVAASLNLLFPGCGHLYLGHAARFLVPALGLASAYVALGILGLLSTFLGYSIAISLLALLVIFGVVDGFLLARRNPDPQPRWYMRRYIYVVFAVCLLIAGGIFPVVRSSILGTETFRDPGYSMAPAILRGEHILVNTRAYKGKVPLPREIVVLRSQGGQLYARRVSSIDSTQNAIEVHSDNPGGGKDSRQWGPIPISAVLGKVTYIFYSPDINRIGLQVR